MDENQEELKKKVEDYVWERFRIYIQKDGKTIRFGKAFFSIEMLVRGSIDVWKANPDRGLFEIVDYMFDYYCT